MAQNIRTPGAGTPRAPENVASQADNFRDTAPAHLVQASHLARRFKLSPAMMAVVASHAYGTTETWREARR